MNKILKYIFIGTLTLGFVTSCSDDQLETSPTDRVSGSTMEGSADAAMIAMNGIYRSMYTAGWSTAANTHQCFGISAYNLMADVMGDDCIMNGMGSGWFWFDAVYNVKPRYTLPGVHTTCGMPTMLGFRMPTTLSRMMQIWARMILI